MNGRFREAPVVFVSAKLNTTDIPPLTKEQFALAQQTLVRLGYVHAEYEELPVFQMTPSGPTKKGSASVVRIGFFNSNRTDAFIFDQFGFEFRNTNYKNFDSFVSRITEVLNAITDIFEFLSFPEVHNVVLSYVDLIAAHPNRTLEDYFSKKSLLPLSAVDYPEADDMQIGQYQTTRFVDSRLRMSISLEQLPFPSEPRFKLVPDVFSENNPEFCNTLKIPEVFQEQPTSNVHYVILFMQGTCVSSNKIGSREWGNDLNDVHELVSDQFFTLLNRDVCNVDWKYIDGGVE